MRAGGDRWGVGASRASKALKSTTLNQEPYSSRSNYSVSSIPVVSAATFARPFCRGSFGIFAV